MSFENQIVAMLKGYTSKLNLVCICFLPYVIHLKLLNPSSLSQLMEAISITITISILTDCGSSKYDKPPRVQLAVQTCRCYGDLIVAGVKKVYYCNKCVVPFTLVGESLQIRNDLMSCSLFSCSNHVHSQKWRLGKQANCCGLLPQSPL